MNKDSSIKEEQYKCLIGSVKRAGSRGKHSGHAITEVLGGCLRVLERRELMSTEMFAHGAQAENEGR